MEPVRSPRLLLYGLAPLLVALAVLVHWALLGFTSPFLLLVPAVVAVAWYGGLGPGLLATALGAAVATYFFFEPRFSFHVDDPTELLALALFGFLGAAISLCGERFLRNERAKRRAEERALLETENSLRDSRERLRAVAEFNQAIIANMGEGLYTVDRQGLATYLNPKAESLLGWASAEALGRNMHDLIHSRHPDGRPLACDESGGFRVLHQGEVLRDHEDVFIRKGGTFFPVVYSSSPLLGQGEISGLVVVFRDVTEGKRAEEALRASQERERARAAELEAVMEATPAAILIAHDPECRRITGNRASLGLLRLPPSGNASETATEPEIAQQTFHFCKEGVEIPGDELPMQVAAARGVEVQRVEFDVAFGHGAVRHIYGNAVPFRGPDGATGGAVGAFLDITELKQAEEALRRERSFLRLVIDTSPSPIFVMDSEQHFLLVNEACARWHGTDVAGMVGKAVADFPFLNSSRGIGLLLQQDREVIGSRKAIQGEAELLGADWQPHWVNGVKVPLVEADGSCDKLLIVMTDVTERKRAEDALRKSQALLAKAQELAHVGSYELTFLPDPAVWWSDELARILGLGPGQEPQSQEEYLARFVHPEDRPRVAREVECSIREGRPFNQEYRVVLADGTIKHLHSRAEVVLDEAGRAMKRTGCLMDVTEQKRLEAQVLRAQRLESIGVLAGGIAHDFNNLLTPMLMAVRLLKKGRSEEDRRGLLDTLEAGVARGGEVVRQLLSFAGGAEGRRGPLDLRHVLREAQGLLEHTLSKAVRLRAEVAADLWGVEGDSTQLSQVVMNLCVNARDAMPEGGELVIEADNVVLGDDLPATHPEAKAGPHVRVAVTDTGTGIPPPLLPKIFDPFFTTKGPGKGSGLGLATVLGIVKSHGGFVGVRSEVGKGTCFTFYLPALPAAEAAPARPPGPPAAGGAGEGILVVDDEPAILLTVRATLEEHGYRVLTAQEGTAALAAYGQHRGEIRAVLLDMMMPGLDGPLLMRALREADPQVRILASSGLQPAGRNAEAIAAGARAFLGKPYTDEQLLAALKDVLHPGS